jgi:hypothetical protein
VLFDMLDVAFESELGHGVDGVSKLTRHNNSEKLCVCVIPREKREPSVAWVGPLRWTL